jgi:hypothetical protein
MRKPTGQKRIDLNTNVKWVLRKLANSPFWVQAPHKAYP